MDRCPFCEDTIDKSADVQIQHYRTGEMRYAHDHCYEYFAGMDWHPEWQETR